MTDLAEQPGPDQHLDATLRLSVAIDQLVQPGVEHLDRSRPETDPEVRNDHNHDTARRQAEDKRDAEIDKRLRTQHAEALARGKAGRAAATRIMGQLLEHGRRVRADADRRAERATARAAATAPLPSLLDQLRDAVESSAGGGTSRSGSVHRAPIGLDAAELLGKIGRTVGYRPESAHLAAHVVVWRDQHDGQAEAADLAEQWVTDARAILTPSSGFEAKARCPICGTRWVRTPGPDGDTVLRGAIQITYASRSARCIAPGCTGRWDRHHLEHLANVLEQDRDERSAG